MTAEDYDGGRPRLEGVRKDVLEIAEELAGAKFSLITFDDTARVQMPLSQDASALAAGVQALSPQPVQYARGSSVAVAGPALLERLRAAAEQHPGRPAFVFYFGDGENTSAAPPAGIAVAPGVIDGGAVLGYGTATGGKMKEAGAGYIQDRSTGEARDAVSRIDEYRLRDIAGQMGIPYVHRDAGDTTSDMLREANPGASRADGGNAPGRIELYWIFALAAFMFALGEPIRHGAALRESL